MGGETYFILQKYRPLYTLFMNSNLTNIPSHGPSHCVSHSSISDWQVRQRTVPIQLLNKLNFGPVRG
jgi:hypothetical protein